MSWMRVLITGGAGFIGANLARYMTEQRNFSTVRVLDDLSTGARSNLDGLDVDFHEGSVTEPAHLERAAEGVDTIVHLGALGSVPRSVNDPLASHAANLTGTLNVLEAARRTNSHVIFSSSSSVYGSNTKLPKSEFDWTRPMSPYAVTKLGAEGYVLAYQHAYDLPTLAFRFFNVYGPLQSSGHAYAAVIPMFLEAALAGKPLKVHGDGRQSRDFTYVDTVCATLTSAVEQRLSVADPINLAFGTNTTLLELIDILAEELGQPLPVEHVDPRPGDVRASQADGERIQQYFPDVVPVELSAGVATTAAWFRERLAG
ncbi:NAD-dependent epimerase/dehydratase family protein [Propionibacteriaceae bacterium Y2011]